MKKHRLDSYYMKRYGITWAQRREIWNKQRGRCAICERHESCFSKRLAVDHDHSLKSKSVRGLACFRCNKLLIGRHTVDTAKKVYEYLLSHKRFICNHNWLLLNYDGYKYFGCDKCGIISKEKTAA